MVGLQLIQNRVALVFDVRPKAIAGREKETAEVRGHKIGRPRLAGGGIPVAEPQREISAHEGGGDGAEIIRGLGQIRPEFSST